MGSKPPEKPDGCFTKTFQKPFIKKLLSILFALVVWFAVLAQLYLIIVNRSVSLSETLIRFFSFFTILTNLLAAIYFTVQALSPRALQKPGTLTALAVYITIVGAVYQLLLRHIWSPTGLQMVVDELLHSVNPVLVILFWYRYESKSEVHFAQIGRWLLYPLAYLVFILVRGAFSGYYPYPFIHVTQLGIGQTSINALLLLVAFCVVALLYIVIGKRLARR